MEFSVSGQLAGRVAVVTGGGSGVGRGVAVAMAAAGAQVAVVGRTIASLDETVAAISGRGAIARSFECDVSNPADCRRLVADVVESFGALDILVNAAHDVREGLLLDLTDEDFAIDWSSGFGGTFSLMQACHGHLARSGHGAIVNVAAATSLKPDTTTFAAYASTKEAIRSITRSAAMEWGQDGIRANTLIPLATTERFDQWGRDHPDEFETILRTIPLKRLGDPVDDVGSVAVFLASDDGRWITGTTLMADGGRGYLR